MWWRSSHGSIELARDRTCLDRSPQLGQQCGEDAGDRTKSVRHGRRRPKPARRNDRCSWAATLSRGPPPLEPCATGTYPSLDSASGDVWRNEGHGRGAPGQSIVIESPEARLRQFSAKSVNLATIRWTTGSFAMPAGKRLNQSGSSGLARKCCSTSAAPIPAKRSDSAMSARSSGDGFHFFMRRLWRLCSSRSRSGNHVLFARATRPKTPPWRFNSTSTSKWATSCGNPLPCPGPLRGARAGPRLPATLIE